MSSETCARCGHRSPTCLRCGRDDPLLGGYVFGVGPLCHTYADARPTCYELVCRDASPDEWRVALVVPPDIDLPDPAPKLTEAFARPRRFTRACTCACASGGFCGGCGHAGCGRR